MTYTAMAAAIVDRPRLATAPEERDTVAYTGVVRERDFGVMNRWWNVRIGIALAWVGGEECMRLRSRMMNDYVLDMGGRNLGGS